MQSKNRGCTPEGVKAHRRHSAKTRTEKMKDRILRIMKSEQMTQQEFSRATGISPASLSSIFNGRTAPTLKHVEALCTHFPTLNMEWLLFGKGEMHNTVEGSEANPNAEPGSSEAGMEVYSGNSQHEAVGMSHGLSASEEAFKGLLPSTKSLPAGTVVLGPPEGLMGMGSPISINSGAAMGQTVGTKHAAIASNGVVIPPNGSPTHYGAYAREGEKVNFIDKKPRKIVEIRIFFDDGTFETFKGN